MNRLLKGYRARMIVNATTSYTAEYTCLVMSRSQPEASKPLTKTMAMAINRIERAAIRRQGKEDAKDMLDEFSEEV